MGATGNEGQAIWRRLPGVEGEAATTGYRTSSHPREIASARGIASGWKRPAT